MRDVYVQHEKRENEKPRFLVCSFAQTVISLRSALDSSREELRRLREIVGDFHGESYANVVERLSLENHVLRRRIIDERTSGVTETNLQSSDDTTTVSSPQSIVINSEVKQRQSSTVDPITRQVKEE